MFTTHLVMFSFFDGASEVGGPTTFPFYFRHYVVDRRG